MAQQVFYVLFWIDVSDIYPNSYFDLEVTLPIGYYRDQHPIDGEISLFSSVLLHWKCLVKIENIDLHHHPSYHSSEKGIVDLEGIGQKARNWPYDWSEGNVHGNRHRDHWT